MQIDIKMESKEKENKNSQEEIEKENGIENPILHNCVGGMKKPSELQEAWQSPFPVRWFQGAKI